MTATTTVRAGTERSWPLGRRIQPRRRAVAAESSPAWYQPHIPTVRALEYRDPRSGTTVLDWVRRMSLAAEMAGEPTPAGLLVREQSDGSTRETLIRVGDVAVESPVSRFGWDACAGRSFRLRCALRPPEMPVYETGDTAE